MRYCLGIMNRTEVYLFFHVFYLQIRGLAVISRIGRVHRWKFKEFWSNDGNLNKSSFAGFVCRPFDSKAISRTINQTNRILRRKRPRKSEGKQIFHFSLFCMKKRKTNIFRIFLSCPRKKRIIAVFVPALREAYVLCICLQRESKRKMQKTFACVRWKFHLYRFVACASSFTYMDRTVASEWSEPHTRRTYGRNMGYFSHCMQDSADHRCHYNVTHSTSPWKTKPKIMFNIRWNEKAFSPHAPEKWEK